MRLTMNCILVDNTVRRSARWPFHDIWIHWFYSQTVYECICLHKFKKNHIKVSSLSRLFHPLSSFSFYSVCPYTCSHSHSLSLIIRGKYTQQFKKKSESLSLLSSSLPILCYAILCHISITSYITCNSA